MVAEALPKSPEAPLVLGLQPAALIDNVAPVDWSLLDQIPGDRGGSVPVQKDELERILKEVNTHVSATPFKKMAGGSVTNTVRGQLFVSNMGFSGVSISRLRKKKGSTAQCVCLVDDSGNRTMRPCLSSAVKIQADELNKEDFTGSKWLVLRYAVLNLEVIQAAIRIAKQEGLSVSLDLASFEMVRNYRSELRQLLESGNIDLCFANEDEAAELLRGGQEAGPEAALEFLSRHCRWAVVTLGSNGCIAKHDKEVVQVPAIGETLATDATGAGDLFASGFLYGLIKGLSLEECCKVGSCSGGSVIRALGGEVTPENWQWMHKQLQLKDLPVPDIRN
ncbi:hypothetical protein EUTSA_v10008038mg [Eutrema salsugineum]|uniref:Carbohydrate kinase PfkB domain-containing protein n=1 Tax=Eutrema salsugineum TaxID=72664 RepID=V4KXS6_EUTSA|nr:hypothetical protein EUTSA_v10008038mg [Eutrema salsugineum]